MSQLLVFKLDEQRYGLNLTAVERILPSVEVTPLPKAPEIVLGVINVLGRIIPVVNIRRRFCLSEREMDLSDRLIVADTGRRPVVLVADAVSGVIERSDKEATTAEKILPGLEYVEGIVKLEDGLILIHDLGKFLSLEEEETLDSALKTV